MSRTKSIAQYIPGAHSAYRFIRLLVNIRKGAAFPMLDLYPAGHFHSPLPDLKEVASAESLIFNQDVRELPGIELGERRQLDLLDEMSAYYGDLPFPETAAESGRYFYRNGFFSYGDAIVLYGLLRHFKPRRVIEIGSGFSSAVMLDTSDLFLKGSVDFTFIDPFPQRLLALLKAEDRLRHRLIREKVQAVDVSLFETLGANDLLFIDSSHVGKVGSDVLHILFEVLPRLKSGVIVHFHDILWPFEYPKEWIVSGTVWNEAYLLRAFLQYNEGFRILYFNSFMARFHQETLRRKMPLCLQNPGGSLWIKREA